MIDDRFLNHPFIKTIKNDKKWSVSDKNKRPISVESMKTGRVYGAKFTNPKDMAAIDTILDILEGHSPSNLAYYLNSTLDGFLIIDIEKICPEDVKKELLKIPYIYGEYSRSGTGIHLVCEIPDEFLYDPTFAKTNVIKVKKDYEIMMGHWVTFTGNQLDFEQKETDSSILPKLIKEHMSEIKERRIINGNLNIFNKIKDDLWDDEVDKFYHVPHRVEIERRLARHTFMKNLKYYNYDNSKYEYGMCGFYYNKLKYILNSYRDHNYTDIEKIYFLYNVLKQKLEHRPKHDEYRQGIPILANMARTMIERGG